MASQHRGEMPDVLSLQQPWARGPWNELHHAANDGSIQRTVALLWRGSPDINQGTPEGRTPLVFGAMNGYLSIVRILLNKGAHVLIRDDEDFTALHLSAMFGHLDVTTLLVDAGADLEAKSCRGHTPLHIAAQEGHLEVVAALVEAGPGLHSTTSAGLTPLHLAAEKGHLKVVAALIDSGGNCDTRLPNCGETPLCFAARWGNLEMVRVLLRAKANPLLATSCDCKPVSLFLPIDVAASHGHEDIVRELIQQVGIEGCGGPSGGVKALILAAKKQHVHIMAVLAEAGVMDVGNALIEAATTGQEEAVQFLLQQNDSNTGGRDAYVNTRDSFGRLPLAHAIGRGRCSPRIVRLLVDAGADTKSAVLPTKTAVLTTGGEEVSSSTQLCIPKQGLREETDGEVVTHETPLETVNRCLRENNVDEEDATEEQLYGLEGIRRLLLRVEAIHAVSWLWPNDVPIIGRAPKSSRGGKTTSTSLRMMLPVLRRRTRRRHYALLRALFR